MMVKFRRLISLVICTVIIIGLCDWSTFFVSKASYEILSYSDSIQNYKVGLSGAEDDEFDNDDLWTHRVALPDNALTDINGCVSNFFDTAEFTASGIAGTGTLDWDRFIRNQGNDNNNFQDREGIFSYIYGDPDVDSDVLPIYVCSYLTGVSDSDFSKRVLYYCSLDTTRSVFYYTAFSYSAMNHSSDKMHIAVAGDQQLHLPIDGSYSTDDNGYSIEYKINWDAIESYINNNEHYDEMVESYFRNDTSIGNAETDALKRLINNLILVSVNSNNNSNNNNGNNNASRALKISVLPMSTSLDSGIALHDSTIIRGSNTRMTHPLASVNLDINSDMIDFGDTTSSFIPTEGDGGFSNASGISDHDKEALQRIVKQLVVKSLNASMVYMNANGINESNIESNINSISSNEPVAVILKEYNNRLKNVIGSYNVNQTFEELVSNGTINLDFGEDCMNSKANLFMRILQYNVATMQVELGDSSMSSDAVFKGGVLKVSGYDGINGDLIIPLDPSLQSSISSSMSGNGYTGMTISQLFSSIDNKWQKDYIASMYQSYLNSYSLKSNDLVIRCVSSYVFSTIPDLNTVGSIRNYTTIQDTIQNDVADVNIELNSGSVLQIAKYCDVIAEYIMGSSIMYVNNDSESVLGMYNASIATLISNNYNYESTNMYFPYYVISGMNLFGGNMEAYNILFSSADNGGSHWDSLMQHLYRTELAFEIANSSQHGEEEGYTVEQMRVALGLSDGDVPEKLQAWKDKDLASTDFGGDSVSINMLSAICALDRMCEFLGIDEWHGTIGEYLQLWEDLPAEKKTALLQNPVLQPNKTGSSLNEFTPEEPLGTFFSIDEKKMSDYWNIGFALSSTFVPMETNVYDASTYTFLNNSDWLYNMEYKYGFYRKALYISNDNNAVNNQLMSASSDGTRVATLSDLLNYDRDIVLYVDNNFYNANKVSDIIGKLDYTSIRNTASSADEPGSLWEDLQNGIKELFDLDTETILKTAGNTYYSQELFEKSLKLGFKGQESWTSGSFVDSYILSQDDIIKAIKDQDEYTVEQSFAVVSAVYRSDKLFNLLLKAINSDNAVFKSSKSVCANPAATKQDWLSIYNYYMLANLESQMKNDAASSLDVNSPIFIDVFGNILTESGLVIIPAAANPTIVGEKWDPYTVAFPTYYYNGNMIQYDEFTPEFYEWLTGTKIKDDGTFEIIDSEKVLKECGGGYFALDNVGFTIRSAVVSTYDVSALINFEQLQKSATNIKQLFYNIAYFEKTKDLFYNKSLLLSNMITEVLRGAPIEFIDYTYEGLDGNKSVGKYGVYMAYKLEELCDTFLGTGGTTGNSMVTMTNLAFMDGVEYIVLYAFKIMFSLLLVGLALNLYFDAVQNKIGVASVGKFIFTCVCLLISVSLVPDLISWSYYKSNKDLLKDEVGYVMMLNYSKDFDGAEVGITKVTTPESSSELYVKLDDVSLDWWSIIYPVLFTNTFNTVNDLYLNQLEDNLIANQDNVVIKSDGLYMNVKDIFNSTTLQYQPSTKTLINYNYAGDANVASFVLPYYVILDQLVADINAYNTAQQVDAYSYNIGSNGHICTYGIVAPYFSSSKFLEDGFDILGLHYIHQDAGDLSGSPTYGLTFTKDDIERMKKSEWYSHYTGSFTSSKIESLYDEARDWMANNKKLMGKVPDEVFLKVFAMQMAIQYNNIMGVPDGNSVEIMNVDTRDIMRFMVGDKANVYKYYSYSFSRYVYEEAGTFGVILSAVFLAVLWVSSLFKPILMVVILGIFIINIIGRKILFRKESKCFEGYLIGCACLCLCNYAYAGMLKLSIVAADMGMGTMATLGIGCVIQIVYCMMLVKIFTVEIKDWKNNGFYEYANRGSVVLSNVTHVTNTVMDRVFGGHRNGRTSIRSNQTGRSFLYNMMHKDDVHIDRANKNTNKLPDAVDDPYGAMAL